MTEFDPGHRIHHDPGEALTECHECGNKLIGRDWYELSDWKLTDDGRCTFCTTQCAGVFDGPPGDWGARRVPVQLRDFASRRP
ncbi:MAG: hypothetical protein ACYTG0_22650 [Planctomycetota bacterium]